MQTATTSESGNFTAPDLPSGTYTVSVVAQGFKKAVMENIGLLTDVAQNINQPRIYGQSAAYDPLNVAFGKAAAVTEYFVGYSTNHQSLQTQLTKRFDNGLAFTTAFTWGKAQNYQTGAQDGICCSTRRRCAVIIP